MNRRDFVARVLGVLAVGPLAKYLPAVERDWKTLPGTPTPVTFKGIPIITSPLVRQDTAYFLSKDGPFVFNVHGVLCLNDVDAKARRLGVLTNIAEG